MLLLLESGVKCHQNCKLMHKVVHMICNLELFIKVGESLYKKYIYYFELTHQQYSSSCLFWWDFFLPNNWSKSFYLFHQFKPLYWSCVKRWIQRPKNRVTDQLYQAMSCYKARTRALRTLQLLWLVINCKSSYIDSRYVPIEPLAPIGGKINQCHFGDLRVFFRGTQYMY